MNTAERKAERQRQANWLRQYRRQLAEARRLAARERELKDLLGL